jgi:hypothetical protein
MDTKQLVDDIPSIKLNIAENGQKGDIRLSAFYGSYNYQCDLDIVKGQEYIFSCPHCEEVLNAEEDRCEECSAAMVPLKIKEGGYVRFCARADCKKHNIEFEDLAHVQDYFKSNVTNANVIKIHDDEQEEEQKEIVKSGTFLKIYCPHCYKSTIEKNKVIFKIANQNDETGFLMLSPYLNVFEEKSTIFIPEGATAKDILCPHCEKSLVAQDITCEKCSSPAVKVFVAAMRKLIDFYFCSMRGCNWHSLGPQDLQYVILEDSNNW